MVGQISSIIRELEKVQDQLSSLPTAATADRSSLLAKQEELRTEAARMAESVDAGCTTQELLTQLAHLRYRRDVLNRQCRRTHPGGHPLSNAGGISQVDERIERVRELLASRGISVH